MLPICLTGAPEYSKDVHRLFFVTDGEYEPIVTESTAERSLPFLAVKCLNVALERVVGRLAYNAGNALLNGLGKVSEFALGIFGKLIDPAPV